MRRDIQLYSYDVFHLKSFWSQKSRYKMMEDYVPFVGEANMESPDISIFSLNKQGITWRQRRGLAAHEDGGGHESSHSSQPTVAQSLNTRWQRPSSGHRWRTSITDGRWGRRVEAAM